MRERRSEGALRTARSSRFVSTSTFRAGTLVGAMLTTNLLFLCFLLVTPVYVWVPPVRGPPVPWAWDIGISNWGGQLIVFFGRKTCRHEKVPKFETLAPYLGGGCVNSGARVSRRFGRA